MSWIVVVLLVGGYFAFASQQVVGALRKFNRSRLHGCLLAALLVVPYVLAVLPTALSDVGGMINDLVRMLAYLLIPTLLILYQPTRWKAFNLLDILAILVIWFPIEFDWLPDVSARLAPGLDLPVPKLTGLLLAFLLFLVIRPIESIGYTYQLRLRDWKYALLALGAFSLVGLPLGFAIHFLSFGLAPFELLTWVVKLLAIYFLIGIPEEMLFRGVIGGLMEQRWGRNWITLLAASLIFGAAHLDNATAGYPVPNLAYMLMATLAGLAYGWAWRKSGKITAAAVTHALVDWIWGVLLAG